MLTDKVADVPTALIDTFVTVSDVEAFESAKEKVEPLKLVPNTVIVVVVPASALFGETETMTGIGAIRISPTLVMPPKTGGVAADNPPNVVPFTTAVAVTV